MLDFVDVAISGDEDAIEAAIGDAIGDLAEDILIVECEEGDEECEKAAQETKDLLDFVDVAISGDEDAIEEAIGDAIGDLAEDILIGECEEGDEECEKAAQETKDFLDFVDGAVAGDDVVGDALS